MGNRCITLVLKASRLTKCAGHPNFLLEINHKKANIKDSLGRNLTEDDSAI